MHRAYYMYLLSVNFPIHELNPEHWSLVYVDLKNKIYAEYDSLKRVGKKENVYQKLDGWFQRAHKIPLKDFMPLPDKEKHEINIQTDCTACGDHLLVRVLSLAYNVVVPNWAYTISEFRDQIGEYLIQRVDSGEW